MRRLPSIDTFPDLIERVVIIISRIAWYEQQKREEHAKPNPDLQRIKALDHLSRECNEYRSELRNRINDSLYEIANGQGYYAVRENRTFSPPSKRFIDIISAQAEEVSKLYWGKEMAEALEAELTAIK